MLYAGDSLETALSEALLRWHGDVAPGDEIILPESDLRIRSVARIVPTRELTLIDCTGFGRAPIEVAIKAILKRPEHAIFNDNLKNGLLKPLADDIFQCSPKEYEETQRWGAWLRSQVPKADGLMWVSRHYNLGRCMVLFDDLCGSDLKLNGTPVPLYGDQSSAEHRALIGILGVLGWGIDC